MGNVVALPARLTAALPLFVVYRSPSDFPGKYVVRQWDVVRGGTAPNREPRCVVDTLDQARTSIPSGLVNIGRQPGDDACIEEVWV